MQLPSSDSIWYVIRAKAGWEHLAARELREGGFETYLPQRRVKNFIRRQRLIINHYQPLMPGYLFLGVQQGRTVDWGRFRDDVAFRHVGRPLRGSMGPLRVPALMVIAISLEETAGVFDETGATKKANHDKLAERFARGTLAFVTEGAFAGLTVMSECVTANDRIKALIGLFGRMTTVEFDPDILEVA